MEQQKITFHREDDSSYQAPAPKRTPKRNKKGSWIPFVILAVGLVLAGVLLVVTGVLDNLLPQKAEPYDYEVTDSETLVRYLEHTSLKPGDTLRISKNMTVDVDEAFGGFAEIPLVNFNGGKVTFEGGTLLLLGGEEGTADWDSVSLDGTTVYVQAPNTDLQWKGVSQEELVNAKTLNGAEHLRELDVRFPGSVFETTVKLENVGSGSLTGVEVTLVSPSYIFVDGNKLTVDLASGETKEVPVKVIATEGGRARIAAYAFDNSGNQVVSGTSDYVTITGNGYYKGDTHTHSTVSEHGNYSTVEQNVKAAYDQGMSFLGSFEQALDSTVISQSAVDAITGDPGALVAFGGVETGDGMGGRHLLAYNTNLRPRADYGIDKNEHWWVYQDAVDEFLTDENAIVVLPHFFVNFDLISSRSLMRSTRGATAMELLYGGQEYPSQQWSVAYHTWLDLNNYGDQKFFALGCSNLGQHAFIGSYFTKGYMPWVTEENIYKMIKGGNYFASNGPELSFTLAGKPMGSDVNVVAGDKLLARYTVSDEYPIETIIIYRHHITHNYDDLDMEEVLHLDLSGQHLNSYSGEILLDADTSADCFYRLEAYTTRRGVNEYNGLVFSNPIWTYTADVSSVAMFHSLEATNGTLHMSDNGTYYLVGKKVSTDDLTVTAAEDAKVLVDYHKLDNENFADYLTVRVIAPDGNAHAERVYIIHE